MKAPLEACLIEQGTLEACKQAAISCPVTACPVAIASMLPYGTHVKAGDVVAKFDLSALHTVIADQQSKIFAARLKVTESQEALDALKVKNEVELGAAELNIEFAQVDLTRYQNEEKQVELSDRRGQIAMAERDLKEAEEKLNYYRTFHKRGFISSEQLKAKEAELDRSRSDSGVGTREDDVVGAGGKRNGALFLDQGETETLETNLHTLPFRKGDELDPCRCIGREAADDRRGAEESGPDIRQAWRVELGHAGTPSVAGSMGANRVGPAATVVVTLGVRWAWGAWVACSRGGDSPHCTTTMANTVALDGWPMADVHSARTVPDEFLDRRALFPVHTFVLAGR